MAISEQKRHKHAAVAARVLGGRMPVRMIVTGRANWRLRPDSAATLGLFVAAFLVSLVFPVVWTVMAVAPLLIVIDEMCRPRRSVAITDEALIVLRHNWWTGQPCAVESLLPPATVVPEPGKREPTIAFGVDRITFPAEEVALLVAATATFTAVPPEPMPTWVAPQRGARGTPELGTAQA